MDYFVVMDDHIHVIFIFEDCDRTLGRVVKAMKYSITKTVAGGLPSAQKESHSNATATEYKLPHSNAAATVAAGLPSRESKGIWQWNYYEHVIRNEGALEKIREYIQNNPEKEKFNWDELDK